MPETPWKSQVAIVTGGSRGIGKATCLEFAARGATVVAVARNRGALEVVADEAKSREFEGVIHIEELDLGDVGAVRGFVEKMSGRFEQIHILVNNAGITRDGLVLTMEDEQFDEVLTTNLKSAFWMIRGIARCMMQKRYGRIINVTSISGIMGNAGQANYAASKAGLIGLTKSVAKELARRNITCNAVAPGFIATDMTNVLPDKIKEEAAKIIPLQRFGRPEEVAAAIAFLASAESSYMTGQTLIVDGGLRM